jgi:ribosome biogenesis GTPase
MTLLSELISGRVCRVDRGVCDVITQRPEGAEAVRARWSPGVTAASHESPANAPCVGDEVLLRDDGDQLWLETLQPRRNAITRASVSPGSSQHQVLAANVDAVAICEPCLPEPSAGRVERLLALAWECGARPAVILTKTDLAMDLARMMIAVQQWAPGAEVIPVSSTTQAGLDEVRTLTAAGETLALLGPSGAGKSTLVNALLGADAQAAGHVRADGKGRHVTAHRELLALDDGSFIVDTPGLRSIGLASADGLDQAFAEISALTDACRFRNCEHRTEPGCAVLGAIERGELDPRRLDSYRKLLREAAYLERRGDARLAAEERARSKSMSRELRHINQARP